MTTYANGGMLNPANPEQLERDRQRMNAFIAAQEAHDIMLERIGPLIAPYPLPRCGYCGGFGETDPRPDCPKCAEVLS